MDTYCVIYTISILFRMNVLPHGDSVRHERLKDQEMSGWRSVFL